MRKTPVILGSALIFATIVFSTVSVIFFRERKDLLKAVENVECDMEVLRENNMYLKNEITLLKRDMADRERIAREYADKNALLVQDLKSAKEDLSRSLAIIEVIVTKIDARNEDIAGVLKENEALKKELEGIKAALSQPQLQTQK